MLRAVLKSLLSRKIRLVLSGLAVVLGVMAVSSAFILSNSMSASFDELFATVNKDLDAQVTAKRNVDVTEDEGGLPAPVPAEVVDQVSALPGVEKAFGSVAVDGARVVGSDGKVIPSQGPPRLGLNWVDGSSLVSIADGAPPEEANEVAINRGLADTGEFAVGDTIEVLTLAPKRSFVVSGIFELSGGRPSLGGETYVAFTTPVAQELMMGQVGVFSSVDLEADAGVSQEELRDTVAAELGDEYIVKTGQQVTDDQASDVQEFISIFQYVLLGFAAVALFVGIFLILNTFSIIIAQRTRELALFRAMGAGRGQVLTSVLVEALVIALIASTLGFLAGIGIASLLKSFFESQNSAPLPGGIQIPAIAVIASYVVGIVVTVLAALLPALRASRIPPIAAMREAADTQKPLAKLTIAGAVVTGLAVIFMAWSLFGDGSTWLLLVGVLMTFIGAAMLAPFVAQPVINVVGRLFSWSLPGKLGRRNSARNPRRTAITAGALMIGLALVTGVSVLGSSVSASVKDLFATDVSAQLVIAGDFAGGPGAPPTFRTEVIEETRELPDVEAASGVWLDTIQQGESTYLAAAADWGAMAEMLTVDVADGEFDTLASQEFLLDDETATSQGLIVGDTLPIATQRQGEQEFTLVGIYEKSTVLEGFLLSLPDAQSGFRSELPNFGYIKVADDGEVDAVKDDVATLLEDDPEVTVQSTQQLADQAASQIDQFLVVVYVLLGLAIIIAILGIINTLALSILERTRELGLLRAVGLTRTQTMRMVAVESIVISVFGAILGVAVGCVLGVAVVKSLEDEGFSTLDFPWTRMGVFLILAVIVGFFASIIPAIRAARTNVLKAIAYE